MKLKSLMKDDNKKINEASIGLSHIKRMDGLVTLKAYNDFKKSASMLLADLEEENFTKEEIKAWFAYTLGTTGVRLNG